MNDPNDLNPSYGAGPDVHYTNLFVCVFVFVSLDVSLLLSCAGTGGRFESWYSVYDTRYYNS